MEEERGTGMTIWSRVTIYALLVFGAFWMLFPFFWMVMTSFKTLTESIAVPPTWVPSRFVFDNYRQAFEMAPFAIYFRNTIFVGATNTVLTLFVTTIAAFAFARLKFHGRSVLFSILLASLMVPGEMLIIQNYVTVASFGWIDTFYALIVPWIASIFYIFLLRQHFLQIPEQLYYAARVDGCGDWKYLWRVMVPNSKNALITIAILNFVTSWNAFLWPLLVTNSDNRRVLTIGLTHFTDEAGSLVNLQMAASTFIVLPMVVLYIFLRRYILEGVARSGIKG